MPWGVFTLVLLVAYVVQSTVLAAGALAWIDLLLVVALVCGLGAPAADARIAGWLAGLMEDIGTDGPFGLHALVFGLAVFLLTLLRDMVNRELWWGRWLIAFIVAFPAEVAIRGWMRLTHTVGPSWGTIVMLALAVSCIAALLAAWLVQLPRQMGRRRRRYDMGR